MTSEQKRVLLHKQLTGEFPGQKFSTIESLLRLEMIEEQGKQIVVTAKGKEYCDEHHLEM
jgi:hypothetical protein